MDCIKLYYKDDLVGILTYNNLQYVFLKNEKCSYNNLINHIGLKDKNEYYSDKLFTFFKRFIPENSRTDILSKAKINEDDSEYLKLKKIAGMELNKNQFWIGL